MSVDAAIHPKEARLGSPDQNSAGTTSSAPMSIWAVITCVGLRLPFTAAFHPACSTALNRAADTSMRSIAQTGRGATMTTQ
jgi:hypothetical protein